MSGVGYFFRVKVKRPTSLAPSFETGRAAAFDPVFCHWGWRLRLTPLYFACGGSNFSVVAGELLGVARADGLQPAGALRSGGAASDSRRSAARGRLQLPVGPLFPGQARLRPGVRAASGRFG